MAQQYRCPNCRDGIRPLRRSQDFFCRACFTSLVVIDRKWVQMMRVSDSFSEVLPIASILVEPEIPTLSEAPGLT